MKIRRKTKNVAFFIFSTPTGYRLPLGWVRPTKETARIGKEKHARKIPGSEVQRLTQNIEKAKMNVKMKFLEEVVASIPVGIHGTAVL